MIALALLVSCSSPPKLIQTGSASFYGAGDSFAGKPTASGEPFDPTELTAAHRTLPFGTRIEVTRPKNGRTVVVEVNDRGPFSGDRILDLSVAAAEKLGFVDEGVARVEVRLVECPDGADCTVATK